MSVSHSLQPGLSALNEFSATLSKALGSLDDSATGLQRSLDHVAALSDETQHRVKNHEDRLQILENESRSQREQLENAMFRAASTQKAVDTQMEDVSKAINRLDLNTLRRSFQKEMIKSIDATEKEIDLLKATPRLPPTATPDEKMRFLLDAIVRHDQQFKYQVTVNESLNKLATQESVVQVYDLLFKEISEVNNELQSIRDENSSLKRTLKELCDSQNQQNKHVLELLRSVGSRRKMEALQEELRDVVRHKIRLDHTELDEEKCDDPDEEPMRRNKRLSTMALFKSDKDNNDVELPEINQCDDELIEDDLVESAVSKVDAPPVDSSSVQNRQKASNQLSPNKQDDMETTNEDITEVESPFDSQFDNSTEETPKTVVRRTVVKKRMPTKVVHEQVVIEEEEEEEVEAQRTIIIRKKVRQRKPRLVEEEESEDEDCDKDETKAQTKLHGDEEIEKELSDKNELSDKADNDVDCCDSATFGTESLADSQIHRQEFDELQEEIQNELHVHFALQQEELQHLQASHKLRLEELEREMSIFKRIAYSVDDLKAVLDTMQQKVNLLTAGESLESKQHDRMRQRVEEAQEKWNKVNSELNFALENLNDPDFELHAHLNNDPDGNERSAHTNLLWDDAYLHSLGPKAFFLRARDLSRILASKVQDLYPRDDFPQTLQKVGPPLREIFTHTEQLLHMDERARDASVLDYCFDDLQCADLTHSLRSYVVDALQASLVVLDEDVSNHRLQQQIDHFRVSLDGKADKSWLLQLEKEIRAGLANKTDHNEFITMTSRLASSAEVQRIQSMIADGHGGGGAGLSRSDRMEVANLRSNVDFQELTDRLESLTNKFVELKISCDKMVPKEEVHEALKAVVDEVKNLRRSYVSTAVFKDSLKSKADATQVEKYAQYFTFCNAD
jgi:hypothetical protein